MRALFGSIQLGNVDSKVFEDWFEKMFGRRPTKCTIPLFKASDFKKEKIVLISGESDKFSWKIVLPREPNQPPSHQ